MNRWFRSSLQFGPTTPADFDAPLAIELRIGRLRRVHAAGMVVAGCVAGWLWLGNSGAAVLGLWAWSQWPRWESRCVQVRVSRLRFAQFGAMRILWAESPMRMRQVFVDEISAVQFAQLRRELKLRLNHGDSSAR